MKYSSRQQAIEAAQFAGSAAKTFKGAAKYLATHARNHKPLHQRGVRISSWDRGHKPAQESRYLVRAYRIAAAQQLWARDDAANYADSVTQPLTTAAASALLNSWPYRRSASHWAGGDHTVTVNIGAIPAQSSGSNRVWSDNGKWAGNNSFAVMTVTPTTLILFPTLTTPDGLALIDAEKIAPREYRLTWLEQSKGFELKPVSGWLIRGFHVEAKSLEAARKKSATSRKQAIAAHLAARQEKRDLSTTFVGLDDSFAAGNCRPATLAFYEQVNARFGEIGGLRADVLLEMRNDIYARRAISAASQHRHAT